MAKNVDANIPRLRWDHRILDWLWPLDFFISYGQGDGSGYVDTLEVMLHQRPKFKRARVFIDRKGFNAASMLPYETERNLRRSDYVIVVIRPFAMGSQWVHREISAALRLRKTILYIDVEEWHSHPRTAATRIRERLATLPPDGALGYWFEDRDWEQVAEQFRQCVSDSGPLRIREPDVGCQLIGVLPDRTPRSDIYNNEPTAGCLNEIERAVASVRAAKRTIRRIVTSATVLLTLACAGGLIGLFNWAENQVDHSLDAISDDETSKTAFATAQLEQQLETMWFRPFATWQLQKHVTAPIPAALDDSDKISVNEYRSAVVKQALAARLLWRHGYSWWPGTVIANRRTGLSLLGQESHRIVRRQLIADLAQSDADNDDLLVDFEAERKTAEGDAIALQALILVIAHRKDLPETYLSELSDIFRDHPSASVHSAARWALVKQGKSAAIDKMERQMAASHTAATVVQLLSNLKPEKRWFALGLPLPNVDKASVPAVIVTFALLEKIDGQPPCAVSTDEIPWKLWHPWMPDVPANSRYRLSRYFKTPQHKAQIPELPIEEISARQIRLFCEKVGKQLEGQYLRITTRREWDQIAFGDAKVAKAAYLMSPTVVHFEQLRTNAEEKRQDNEGTSMLPNVVGHFMPNEQGCFDVFGNVHELCSRDTKGTRPYEFMGLSTDGRPNIADGGLLVGSPPGDADMNLPGVGFRLAFDPRGITAAEP